jgi:large subunit ribosomal protein L14
MSWIYNTFYVNIDSGSSFSKIYKPIIIKESKLKVIDNSGAKLVKCIKISGFGKKFGSVGSLLLVTILRQNYTKKINKKNIYYGLVVSTRQYIQRGDGSFLKFGENKIILFSKVFKLLGTRLYGPLTQEIRSRIYLNKKEKQKYLKILSYATHIL